MKGITMTMQQAKPYEIESITKELSSIKEDMRWLDLYLDDLIGMTKDKHNVEISLPDIDAITEEYATSLDNIKANIIEIRNILDM